MPTEYTNEEKAIAQRIKDHWRKYCRQMYRELRAAGVEALDHAALNMAWDTLQQAKGYEAGGVPQPMAESEVWYGMVRDSQAMNRRG